MIDFGMAVKYDHGVWFKDMPTKKTPHQSNRGCFGKSGGFDGEKSLWNPRCKKLCAQKKRDLKIQMGQVWSAFTMLLGFTSTLPV